MSPAGRVAIGIDIGTSAVKAEAISEAGEAISHTSQRYPSSAPFEGAVEQDPEHWWAATLEALRGVVSDLEEHGASVGPETTTIALTGQMHTSVFLGEGGTVLRPAILWSDKRATEECRDIEWCVPGYARTTGNNAMPAFTVAHLLWSRAHEPEVFEKIELVLNPKDEVRRRLGAGIATEPADASGTGMLDTRRGAWSDDLLAALGLSKSLLPPIIDSHAVSGTVRFVRALRADDPLRSLAGVPVIGGGGDQAAQAVALGVTEPGRLGLSLGTSGVAFSVSAEPRHGAFRHSYEDLWLVLDSTHSAGLSLAWLSEVVGVSVSSLTEDSAGPEGVPFFLPYLQGHRGDDGGAPGAFIELSPHQTRRELAYSAMEGVAFELKRLARSIGADEPEGVSIGGGGARSRAWRQIIANVFAADIRYSDRGSAFGAAVMAAESAGWAQVLATQLGDDALTSPDPALSAATAERHRRFSSYAERLRVVEAVAT